MLPITTTRFFGGRSGLATAALLVLSADAFASGFPPFAVNDSITVKRNATVSVLDSGAASVLANDFDFERDPLSARLTREPRHGDLRFNDDGTFVYEHDGGAARSDEFRYRAFDGRRFSRDARVTITIVPGDPVPPEIVGQRDLNLLEDTSIDITLADLIVVDPDSSYPTDFGLELAVGDNYEVAGATILPLPDYNGTLDVPVRVSDGTNLSDWFRLLVVVIPDNDPPFVVRKPADQEAIEGTPFSLVVADFFDDIDDGESLKFRADGLPTSGSLELDENTGILSGTPRRSDASEFPYSVRVTATDAAGASAELSFELVVFGEDRADMAIQSDIAENPVLVGERSVWRIELENRGPAGLEQGELVGSWTTSGPTLSLDIPDGCVVSSNNSSTPSLRCPLTQVPAGASLSFAIPGRQDGDGDSTLIASIVADDPRPGDNTALVSAQVAIAFSEGPTQILSEAGADLAVADFNLDGLSDLVVADTQTIVYFNAGNRTLQTTGTVLGEGGSFLALPDWDGDGLLDVAVAGQRADRVRVFPRSGDGSFGPAIEVPTEVPGDATALTAIDIEGDGVSELVLGTESGAIVLRGGGAGADVLPVDAVTDVVAADLDQDSYTDLVIVTASDRSVNILGNSGNGSFSLKDTLRLGSAARVVVADLDGSGVPELLVATDGADLDPPRTLVLTQRSEGTYELVASLGASAATDLLTGDVDGDGMLDILAVNGAGVHQLYFGQPGLEFTLAAEQIVSPGMLTGVIVDYNNDESSDLVLAGKEAGVIELHANNGIGRLGLGDRIAPEIALLGEASVNIPSGSEYVDSGATASDDIDGDLTSAITVSGAVNTTVIGTYTLIYTVSDRANNTSQVSRTVTVGVNQGTGGGGGGVLSALTLIALSLVLAMRSVYGRRRLTDGDLQRGHP